MPLSNRRRAARQNAANRAARRQNPVAQNDALANRREERNQQRRFVNQNFKLSAQSLTSKKIIKLTLII